MFISTPIKYGYKSDHDYKILDEIRQSRPWTGIYSNKFHKIFTCYTHDYLKENNKLELIKYKGEYSPCDSDACDKEYAKNGKLYLHIVDNGFLKCDPIFIFKNKKMRTDYTPDDIIKTATLSGIVERTMGYDGLITYLDGQKGDNGQKGDGNIHFMDNVIMYESKTMSYPHNLTSGQQNKYYMHIEYDPELVEFIGFTQTVIQFDSPAWWGPTQQYYFSSPCSISHKLPASRKMYMDKYYISMDSDSDNSLVKLQEPRNDEDNKDDVIEYDCFMNNETCDQFVKIINEPTDKITFIDTSIKSLKCAFNLPTHYTKALKPTYLPDELANNFYLVNEMRILRYGQQSGCLPHIDNAEFNGLSTHRILIYLTDFDGGNLKFTGENDNIVVKKGKAVIFNMNKAHYATEVTNGVKYIITGELIKK